MEIASFPAVAEPLQVADLQVAGFEDSIDTAKEGDFVLSIRPTP